jgi:hypothetical protein
MSPGTSGVVSGVLARFRFGEHRPVRRVATFEGLGGVADPVELDVGEPLALAGVAVLNDGDVIDVSELGELFLE